jgi:hypothetical protein
MATVTTTRQREVVVAPVATPSPWPRRGIVALTFVTAMVAMIHWTPSQLSQRLPGNLGDPVLVIWTLRWGAHGLVTHPTGVFNANIFWPHGSTLAYADGLLSVAPVYAVLYWITGNWTLAFNLLLLGLMALNLGATYSLTRWLTGRTTSGVIAALAFGFSAMIAAQMDHPQLQVVGLLPLAFLLLFKLLEEPSARRGLALGAVTAVIGLGALYWAALWAVSVVVVLAGWLLLRHGRWTRRLAVSLGTAAAVALVLVGPTARPYLHVQHTEPRRVLQPELALHAHDLFRSAGRSWLWGGLSHGRGAAAGDEHRLFIGFLTMALAAVGLVALAATRRRWRRTRRQIGLRESVATEIDRSGYLVLLVLAGAVAFVLALGPTYQGVPGPWRLLYYHAPGFGGIRVTARLAAVGLLAVAVLAGAGLAVVFQHIRSAPVRQVATAVAALVILAELAAPWPWTRLPSDQATLAVYDALRSRPAGAVAELPMFSSFDRSFGWAYTEPTRMVYSTIDFHPRLNGYSGYLPATYEDDVAAMATFPSADSLARLKLRQVRYLILDVGQQNGYPMFTEAQARKDLAELPAGARADRYGNAWLVDLGPA